MMKSRFDLSAMKGVVLPAILMLLLTGCSSVFSTEKNTKEVVNVEDEVLVLDDADEEIYPAAQKNEVIAEEMEVSEKIFDGIRESLVASVLPVEEQVEDEILDCGGDLDCFMGESAECGWAKWESEFGTIFETRGKREMKCVVYRYFMDDECLFGQEELSQMLQRWKEGSYSTSDWDSCEDGSVIKVVIDDEGLEADMPELEVLEEELRMLEELLNDGEDVLSDVKVDHEGPGEVVIESEVVEEILPEGTVLPSTGALSPLASLWGWVKSWF